MFGAVTVEIKARKVTVKGDKGTITRDFSHLAVELQKMKQNNKKRDGLYIRIRMWFGGYKQACSVNTLKSLMENMITGVTEVRFQPSLPGIKTNSSSLLMRGVFLFLSDSI